MSERKHKQTDPGEPEIESDLTLEPAHVEVGSGYTLQIKYDNDQKPTVNVKTYGNVDLAQIRREIAKIFPNAKIGHLGEPGTVTVGRAECKKIRVKTRRE